MYRPVWKGPKFFRSGDLVSLHYGKLRSDAMHPLVVTKRKVEITTLRGKKYERVFKDTIEKHPVYFVCPTSLYPAAFDGNDVTLLTGKESVKKYLEFCHVSTFETNEEPIADDA